MPVPERRLPTGFRFPRPYRLKRRRLIRPLFEREAAEVGRVSVGVVQLRYRRVSREATGQDVGLQVGFAPGRRARTKVGRNRLRRLMRETWRLGARPLLEALAARPDAAQATLTVFVVFRGREATAAPDIRRDLPAALRRLAARQVEAGPAQGGTGEPSPPVEQSPGPPVPPASADA